MSEGSSGTLDCVLSCLSKPPHERTEEDIEGLLDVLAMLPAFSKLTSAVRRSILKLMVLKTVDEDNTVIINNGEEVDSWYVVFNGCLKFCREQEQEKLLHAGESYGINQSLKVTLYSGRLLALKDCQYGFLHISEFSEIIHEGEEHIKRETDEDEQTVKVMELRAAGPKREGYFII
ncbi:rap guanine nucleotide exchange factor 2-like isoform X1 [Dysidea avara]|uniref:rap guanine nucleotide exchange factor 2-like isoform X1 n=1 Tax=Dysidea avara TaxID=196820 RepID=UPI003332EEEC